MCSNLYDYDYFLMHGMVVFVYLSCRCAWYEPMWCGLILICTMWVWMTIWWRLLKWMRLSSLNMLMYELNDKVCSHEWFTKYVWSYGISHVHCTTKILLGSWTRSCNDLCDVKSLYVQIIVAYCKSLT